MLMQAYFVTMLYILGYTTKNFSSIIPCYNQDAD